MIVLLNCASANVTSASDCTDAAADRSRSAFDCAERGFREPHTAPRGVERVDGHELVGVEPRVDAQLSLRLGEVGLGAVNGGVDEPTAASACWSCARARASWAS